MARVKIHENQLTLPDELHRAPGAAGEDEVDAGERGGRAPAAVGPGSAQHPSQERAMADRLTGGCLCGMVRYEVLDSVFDAGYCHCSTCRRSIGAPVLAWANVRRSRFTLHGSGARHYRSSSKGCRVFCGTCGSSIAFVPDDESGLVSFSIATLDDPEAIRPTVHMCHADQLGWFDIADELPRFEGPTLPHPAKRS